MAHPVRLPRLTIRLRLTAVYGALFLVSGLGLLAITYLLVRHATGGAFHFDGPDGLVGSVMNSGHVPSGPPASSEAGTVVGGGSSSLSPTEAAALAHQMAGLATTQRADELHQLLVQSGIALAIMSLASMLLGWLVAGRVLRPLRTITELTRDISATDLHRRLALSGPDDEVTRLGGTVDGLLERLEAAFAAQRHFVANASHELRTPITVAQAMLQMTLSNGEATLDTFRATCQDVVKEGQQQERLIEALLVLAHSERGLDRSTQLDLSVVTADVLRTRRTEAVRRGLLLRSVLGPAPVDGDVHLAERLVSNLVDNALRHNGPDGTIDVSTAWVGGRVLLTVTNTGPVVPPAEVARLLQPFQRIGADATDHSDGLGLGLSIVQAVADAHDAVLRCRAQDHGGLHIEVDFPARVTGPPQRSRSAVAKPVARLRRRLRSGDGLRVDPRVAVGDP